MSYKIKLRIWKFQEICWQHERDVYGLCPECGQRLKATLTRYTCPDARCGVIVFRDPADRTERHPYGLEDVTWLNESLRVPYCPACGEKLKIARTMYHHPHSKCKVRIKRPDVIPTLEE